MKRKGVTLIEMIIVIAILSTVLVAINSVLISSSRTFATANSLANIQNQSLVIGRMVSSELKNSSTVTILDSVPSSFNSDSNYIYLNQSDNKIYIKKAGKSAEQLFETKSVDQDIIFTYVDDYNIKVDITLKASSTDYTNTIGINFLNIPTDSKVNGTTGKCISYAIN